MWPPRASYLPFRAAGNYPPQNSGDEILGEWSFKIGGYLGCFGKGKA
jgi:hypothetical protein